MMYAWALKHMPALVGAALLLGLLAWAGNGLYDAGGNACRLKAERVIAYMARAEAAAVANARADERTRTLAMADIAAQHERDKDDAQEAGALVTADLAADNLRLRRHWQACIATSELSATASAARERDATIQLQRDSAGRIVRAVAECDAQGRAAQAVIMADRQ